MEPAKLHIREVQAIGVEQHLHFCTGEPVATLKYPENPTAHLMRDLRVVLGISLRDAARALGLQAVELSALEMGRSELADPRDGFHEVVRRLLGAVGRERRTFL